MKTPAPKLLITLCAITWSAASAFSQTTIYSDDFSSDAAAGGKLFGRLKAEN